MPQLTVSPLVEIDGTETRVRVRLLDEINAPRTAAEIGAAALERAVCNRWGPRAFLHRDYGLPNYGQIFRSLGDRSATSITGRVHYRVTVPALPAAHLAALAEWRDYCAEIDRQMHADECAGRDDAIARRPRQPGRGADYDTGYGYGLDELRRAAEWRRAAAQAGE